MSFHDDNYQMASLLQTGANLVTLGIAGFVLGVYLVPAVGWVVAREGCDYSPLAIAAGACLGLMAGGLVGTPLGLMFHLDAQYIAPTMLGLQAIGACAGAWLGYRWRRERPPGLVRRALRVGAVITVVIAGLWTQVGTTHNFPGSQASLDARQAWATNTFDWRYEEVAAHLRVCGDVTSRLGTVRAIAPIAGANRAFIGPGETTGTFTLELLAERGRGVAKVDFMAYRPAAGKGAPLVDLKGTLDSPTGTVPIQCQ